MSCRKAFDEPSAFGVEIPFRLTPEEGGANEVWLNGFEGFCSASRSSLVPSTLLLACTNAVSLNSCCSLQVTQCYVPYLSALQLFERDSRSDFPSLVAKTVLGALCTDLLQHWSRSGHCLPASCAVQNFGSSALEPLAREDQELQLLCHLLLSLPTGMTSLEVCKGMLPAFASPSGALQVLTSRGASRWQSRCLDDGSDEDMCQESISSDSYSISSSSIGSDEDKAGPALRTHLRNR